MEKYEPLMGLYNDFKIKIIFIWYISKYATLEIKVKYFVRSYCYCTFFSDINLCSKEIGKVDNLLKIKLLIKIQIFMTII